MPNFNIHHKILGGSPERGRVKEERGGTIHVIF